MTAMLLPAGLESRATGTPGIAREPHWLSAARPDSAA